MGQQVRYGRRRSHGAGALIAAVILVVAALIAAWTLLPRLFTPRETARTAEEAYCAAVSSDGARRTLTPDQAQNAALIANIAVTRGLPDHAATVAIATAMQESRLTNLDYGDLDSLGLFQQRPSQGWGTAEQVSDMTYATNIFYDHLLRCRIGRRFRWRTPRRRCSAQATRNYMPHGMRWHALGPRG